MLRTISAISAPKVGSDEAKSGMAIGSGGNLAPSTTMRDQRQRGAGQQGTAGEAKLERIAPGDQGHVSLLCLKARHTQKGRAANWALTSCPSATANDSAPLQGAGHGPRIGVFDLVGRSAEHLWPSRDHTIGTDRECEFGARIHVLGTGRQRDARADLRDQRADLGIAEGSRAAIFATEGGFAPLPGRRAARILVVDDVGRARRPACRLPRPWPARCASGLPRPCASFPLRPSSWPLRRPPFPWRRVPWPLPAGA